MAAPFQANYHGYFMNEKEKRDFKTHHLIIERPRI